jgi:hypothetical protein
MASALASQSTEKATCIPAENPSSNAAGTFNIDKPIDDKFGQLPALPSPLPPSHAEFKHVMPTDEVITEGHSVFLAGSIEMGEAIQWQQHMANFLHHLPLAVHNPRRGMWNNAVESQAKDKDFRAQVVWELSALESSSVICFFFDKNTRSPVTMMELGLWAHSGKVVVCCHHDFWKAGNVHLVCERYKIPYVESFAELVPLVKMMLKIKGMDINMTEVAGTAEISGTA